MEMKEKKTEEDSLSKCTNTCCEEYFATPCSLDIRLYWAVEMLIFLATWAEITN
jgi:hypothetical protein